jgi:hypothetical protein
MRGAAMSRPLWRLLAMGTVVLAFVCACGQSTHAPTAASSAPPDEPTIVTTVSGFPLDRTLDGLVGYTHLGAVLLVKDVVLEAPRQTGPGTIVTPAHASVVEALHGPYASGQTVRFTLLGGQVGRNRTLVDATIGPEPSEVAALDRLVVAGALGPDGLVPSFIYAVEEPDYLSSLMISGSSEAPRFRLAQLQAALAAR